MGSGGKTAVGVIFCIVLPGILQCVGFFKNEWAASPNATCPIVKLRDNSCGEDYEAVYALELIPALVFILPIAAVMSAVCGWDRCSDGDDDDVGNCFALLDCTLWFSTIFCALTFPFVGILILTGCIMFSTHFATVDLGISFILCLSAGCFHILGMIYLICKKLFKNDTTQVDERTVSVPPQANVQTVSGSLGYIEERTTVVHDSSTGTTIFSRDFRFISIFE